MFAPIPNTGHIGEHAFPKSLRHTRLLRSFAYELIAKQFG